MDKQQKQAFVKEMQARLESMTGALFLGDFRGVSVSEDTELRGKLREAGVEMRVVKNRLFKLATQGTAFEGLLDELLVGPTAVLIAEDVVAGAKALKDIKKQNEDLTFTVKGGALESSLLTPEQIETLASLPNREQLIAQFMGLLQSPLRDFAGLLQAPIRDFMNVTKALEQQKSA